MWRRLGMDGDTLEVQPFFTHNYPCNLLSLARGAATLICGRLQIQEFSPNFELQSNFAVGKKKGGREASQSFDQWRVHGATATAPRGAFEFRGGDS